MKNNKKIINRRSIAHRLYLGFKKGISVATLPASFMPIHNNPIIRVFRVLAGFSWIAIFGGKAVNLPFWILVICFILTLFHIIYLSIVTILKFKHLRTVLKSEQLD